ncbi:MAG: glycosyltransferase family 2 protein [Bacteroidota bacterium]
MCRVTPLVSYVIITRNRSDDLLETVTCLCAQQYPHKEIVVFDNGSEAEQAAKQCAALKLIDPGIVYARSARNLGVSGGRNAALVLAHGEILITIDDDAVFLDPEATTKIVRRMTGEERLGVLALRIVDYETGVLERYAFPTRQKDRDSQTEFETTWFIGAGHAVRRKVYDDVGLYNDYFPYGHEELDLSFRIIDHGYRILYFPETIRHKKTKNTRNADSNDFLAVKLENRIKVAIRNLPWRYVASTFLLHSALMLLRFSHGNPAPVLIACKNLAGKIPALLAERKVIQRLTQKRILKMKGPILY